MTNKLNNNIVEKFESFYSTKQFDKALEFLKENENSFDPSIYHYNLGSIYYSKEEFVSARISFEKAKELGFTSTESLNAIEKTKEALDIVYIEQADSQIEEIQSTLVDIPINAYISVSLILLILVFVKRFNFLLKSLCLVLSIIPMGYYLFMVNPVEKKISLKEKVIYKGPSKMFEQVQLLPKGMIFYIDGKVEGWTKIILPKSHEGWIVNEDMEKL